MKSALLFWSLLFLGWPILYSQVQEPNWGTGALLNTTIYEQTPIATPITHKNYADLPPQYSLKRYCPTPGNQYNTATCVGWVVSYGARTMIKAMEEKWNRTKDQKKIDGAAFSPTFIYNKIVPKNVANPCYHGAYLKDGLQFLRDSGTLPIQDFPFDKKCEVLPTAKQIQKAYRYSVKDYSRLTFSKEDNAKVNKVRHSLANDLPVVGAMKIRKNLKYGDHAKNNYIWKPNEGDMASDGAHAILVVGYDDEQQVFEIMNSWGTTWANGGFIYIDYVSFNKYVKELYHIAYDFNASSNAISESQELLTIAASVGFKQLPTDGLGESGNCVPGVIENMIVDKGKHMFKMTSPYAAWTGYQIQLTSFVKNINVYVFSFNSNNNTNLLYPFDNNVLSLHGESYSKEIQATDLIPYKQSMIAIPHENYCIQLDEQTGTINCILLSRKSLPIHEVLTTIEEYPGRLIDRLQGSLKERILLPNEAHISWGAEGIHFKGDVPEQAVIPIIVDMNHVTK